MSAALRLLTWVLALSLLAGCLQAGDRDDDADDPRDPHRDHPHHPTPGHDPHTFDLDEWDTCRVRLPDGSAAPCPRENVLEEGTGFADPAWRCTGTFQGSVAYFWHEGSGLLGVAWNLTGWDDPERVEILVDVADIGYRFGRDGPARRDAAVFPIAFDASEEVVIALQFLDPHLESDVAALQGGQTGLHWFQHGNASLPVYSVTRDDGGVSWFPPDAPTEGHWYRIERPHGTLNFDARVATVIDVLWSFAHDAGDACDAFR